jgi:hypothetical protein
MKYLRLLLCLSVAALFTHSTVLADSYDSETATIQKKSDHSAKVLIDKGTYTAPVSFDDGATWDNVKDHYEVDPSVASGIKSGTIMLSVGADGTVSFKKCNCSSSKKK